MENGVLFYQLSLDLINTYDDKRIPRFLIFIYLFIYIYIIKFLSDAVGMVDFGFTTRKYIYDNMTTIF